MSLKTNNIGDNIEKLKLNKLIEIPQKKNLDDKEISRAFSKLKTNIQFLNINNKNSKAIYVTSSYKEEGKSFVTSKLAISYAEIGKKVLIIDSDLKNGCQSRVFNLPNDIGFSNLLSGLDDEGKEIDDNINGFIRETGFDNLYIITSGTVPPNPTEIISLPKTVKVLKQLSRIFDVIIIDGTSTLLTDEALVLSRLISSTILVLDYNSTNKEEFVQAKEDIENVGGSIIGVVLNKVKSTEKINIFKKVFANIKNCFKNLIIKIKTTVSSRKIKLLEEGKFDENYNRKDIVFNKRNKSNDTISIIDTPNVITEEKKEIINSNSTEDIKDDDLKLSEDDNKAEEKIKTSDKSRFNNKNEVNINNKKIEEKNNDSKTINSNNTIIENQNTELNNTELDKDSNNDVSSSIQNYLDNENNVNEENDERIIIKPAIILKAIRNKITSTGRKTESIQNSINRKKDDIRKEKNEKIVNIELQNKDEITNDTKNINEDEIKHSNNSNNENLDDFVFVIVDSERGTCLAMNKNCYVEKLVRGLDKSDGFYKMYYSLQDKARIMKGFMNMYNISKEQAQRIDPLVYYTLMDFDEKIWIEQKKESNTVDLYVKCLIKEYEKKSGESRKKYEQRCVSLRRKNLELVGIEINYRIDSIFNSSNMSFSDKIEMKNYSKYLKEVKKQIISEGKNNNIEPIENENEIEAENKQNNNENMVFDKLLEKEKQKKIRSERKKEAAVLKKVERERNAAKRKKLKHERDLKNKERQKLREENRKIRELQRIKQKEEARIEEELLEDNLYPKTKNNKDL